MRSKSERLTAVITPENRSKIVLNSNISLSPVPAEYIMLWVVIDHNSSLCTLLLDFLESQNQLSCPWPCNKFIHWLNPLRIHDMRTIIGVYCC